MNSQELVKQAASLQKRIKAYGKGPAFDGDPEEGAKAQVCEFLKLYAGPKSAFLKRAETVVGTGSAPIKTLSAILDAFIEFVEAGLAQGLSPERQAKIDVVSDFLGQAQALLE